MMNNIKFLLFAAFAFMNVQKATSQNYDPKNTAANNKPEAVATVDKSKLPKNLKEVVIVYKTHFDIGYSELVEQVVHDYRTSMADKVIDAIEKNKNQPKDKQFVWTVSGWPMKQIVWDGQSPDRKKKIEDAIKQGNLKVHAFPFSMHVESADAEDLVRGLNISSSLTRKYNIPLPIAAKMSDVPGQSWIIPTLLTHAGVKFYHMGGPLVNLTFGLPPFFWWEGPDGSKLLTLYNNGYGSPTLPSTDWPYKTWLRINMTGDNEGPPSPETVAKDIAFYEKLGIKARVGSMDDFANMILKEDLSGLPVVRSDIGDPWIHGTMSKPEASKLAQNIRPAISGVEALNTQERLWGIYRPDIKQMIATAHENSLSYSEHTWGLANQHYSKLPYGKEWKTLWEKGFPPQYKLMEKSWKDHEDYIGNVERAISTPYYDAVATIADNVKVEGNHITVYNPLPWKRSGEIKLDTRLIFGNSFVSLKPVDGGEPIMVSHEEEAIEDKQPFSRFYVKDIPAMGYRTFIATEEPAKGPAFSSNKEEGIIESPFFKAKLDSKKGSIVSLIDKRTGKELVDPTAPQGLGQYFYERFSYNQLEDWLNASLYPRYRGHRLTFVAYDMPKDEPYKSYLPQNMELSIVQSAIDIKAVLTGYLKTANDQMQQVSMTLTLSGSEPVSDIELNWQKQPDSWPEAGWLCLPFKVNNPTFQIGRLGGNVNPEKDMTVKNANYKMWWVNTGAAVYDSTTGSGVAIYSPDAPMLSIGEPGEYKFDSIYNKVQKSYFYLNLYNNHWRTNFPGWVGNGQKMSAKVRLWSFDKYDTESALFTPAMETKVPLMAASSKLTKGQLPTTQQGLGLSRKGIAVTAFGANPDGDGTILRLWEQAGNSGKVTVVLPSGSTFKQAQPVNLRGESNGTPIKIIGGKFEIDLHAYAPYSLLFK